MISSLICFREMTPANPKQIIIFTAPGVYYPAYGKGSFQLQGQGQPGNASVPGSPSGSNLPIPGNVSGYNPTSYNAATPGNDNYYPYVPGNANYNSYTPGNVVNNPAVPGNVINSFGQQITNTYSNYYGGNTTSYDNWEAPNRPNNYSWIAPDASAAANITYYTNGSNYNPVTPGSYSYANPGTPGSISGSNPDSGGDYAYTNPATPGNDKFTNTANYYPPTPGTANYNASVSGNTAPTNVVLGVSLPGGGSDSAAPVIGYVTVPISYSSAGIPISVPPGGYIKIKNI